MRKTSFDFNCFSSLARFALVSCLGVLLLFPVSVLARSRRVHHHRHARVHREHHAARAIHSRTAHYRIRRGDTLSEVAHRFGVTTAELRSWNHLRSNRIVAGQHLRVAGLSGTRAVESASARSDEPSAARVEARYRIHRGDTLSSVAHRFGVTTAELRSWNHLRSNRIVAGQRLFTSSPAEMTASTRRSEAPVAPSTKQDAVAENVSMEKPAPTAPVAMPVAEASAAATTLDPAQPIARGAILRKSAVPRLMPTALFGTHEVLVHQNIIADVEGLQRIQDTAQLKQMVHDGDLVALPVSSALIADPRLPHQRRYCRPWTAKFLEDLARAHDRLFDRPLRVTSAVRTVAFQRRLSRRNANAAPISGNIASPHLTGEAIDIGKKGMSRHEIAWMREVLGKLQAAGKLDVEEEFHQACFHISVYKTYVPGSRLPERLIASEKTPSTATAVSGETEQTATLRPASESVARSKPHRVRHERVRRRTRRAVARRHRRHHSTMSLLAAGIR